MRRVALVLVAMALALVLASGGALAAIEIGTYGPDTLRGTNKADTLIGKGGDDVLISLHGRDELLGGPGKDCLICVTPGHQSYTGDKNLQGGAENDLLWSGKGTDRVVGGEGNDFLSDDTLREFSEDYLSGGPGNDVIDVLQYRSARDRVECGSGFDRVAANGNDDVAADCEQVVVFRGGKLKEFWDVLLVEFYEETVPPDFFDALPECPV
jgi:Ca2+-binding RTX toxin-like protein